MSDARTDLELPETMHVDDAAPAEGERQLSPREIKMAEIAARAQERREAEMRQGDVYDQDARAAGLSMAADDEPESAAAVEPVQREAFSPAPAPVSAPVAAEPAQQVRAIHVDGRQFEVTEQQYQELARLGMIANAAMQQYQPPPVQQAVPEPPRAWVDPDRVRETVKKIQYGGEDEAAAALSQLVQDVVQRVPVAPAVDTNAIVREAAEVARQQAQLLADSQVIRQEFADIFAHPQRTFLAKTNVDVIRQRDYALGRSRPDIEVYREAGNMVREAMGLSRPGSDVTTPPALQAPSVASRADVIERKRSAPRMTQAIDRRAPSPETPRAPTGSEIVDAMRAQRGQASMR